MASATPPRAVAPKSRRDREAVNRYEEIVDAAAQLFSERGYAATSIQDIANRVGLLKGSLYHYINTKEDLLYAVILEAHLHTAALGAEAIEMSGDANRRLAHIVRGHLTVAAGQMAKVRVFYNESGALPPARLQEIVTDRASYEESIRRVIRDGQAAGVFAPHLDPPLTGIAILAILNSVIQWFRPDGPRSLDEIIDVFTDLILRSVANPPDPSPQHPKEQP